MRFRGCDEKTIVRRDDVAAHLGPAEDHAQPKPSPTTICIWRCPIRPRPWNGSLNLGAKRGEGADRVFFGRTIFAFAKAENAKPSAGSAIDHIGISVADVDAKMKELQAAGAKVVSWPAISKGCSKWALSRIRGE